MPARPCARPSRGYASAAPRRRASRPGRAGRLTEAAKAAVRPAQRAPQSGRRSERIEQPPGQIGLATDAKPSPVAGRPEGGRPGLGAARDACAERGGPPAGRLAHPIAEQQPAPLGAEDVANRAERLPPPPV